jgi:hypothetical protein
MLRLNSTSNASYHIAIVAVMQEFTPLTHAFQPSYMSSPAQSLAQPSPPSTEQSSKKLGCAGFIDMTFKDGTVVSAPSTPRRPASMQSKSSVPVASNKLFVSSNLDTSFRTIFRGISSVRSQHVVPKPNTVHPSDQSASSSNALTAIESKGCMFLPSAFEDGTLVCRKCHDIVQPDETELHEETCERNESASSFVHADAPEPESPPASRRPSNYNNPQLPSKQAIRNAVTSELSAQAQPPQKSSFSISDIQARFKAKQAETKTKLVSGKRSENLSSENSVSNSVHEDKPVLAVKRDSRGRSLTKANSSSKADARGTGSKRTRTVDKKQSESQDDECAEIVDRGDCQDDHNEGIRDDDDNGDGYNNYDSESSDADVILLPSRAKPNPALASRRCSRRHQPSKTPAIVADASAKRSRCNVNNSHSCEASVMEQACSSKDAAKQGISSHELTPAATAKARKDASKADFVHSHCFECGLAGGVLQVPFECSFCSITS